MKVCLVSPPTVTDFEDPAVAESEAVRLIAEHAPIGILSLAAVLDAQARAPQLVDLNQWYYRFLRADRPEPGDFALYVTNQLDELEFDVLGLSTICSSYPLTLRIAGEVKRRRPRTVVVLGGPQASVVDAETLEAFADVDVVVRGEAEASFPQVLDALSGHGALDDILGITYRHAGQVRRTRNGPPIEDLDALPLPAFHLYGGLKDCRYVPLELGRGCPFACTFCSTNDFFRRNFRLKSPARMIEHMRAIRDDYGITTFDLIHDMFTVDRKRVVAFCEMLLAAGETFHWNCSARTDCIDEELIALMARAGCKAIFFGIETGSARMQRLINKKLDLAEAARMIACTDRHEITTAVSLITGFPDEHLDDLRDTVGFMADTLRFDHAEPQFHLLAPLVETPIFTRYREQLIFDDIVSDMSHQGWRQVPADRELIAAHREVFGNFYSAPTPLDRLHLKELREFLLNGSVRLRWMLVALHQDSGDLLRVFDEWRQWRLTHRPDAGRDVAGLGIYYANVGFADDVMEFLRASYLPGRRVTSPAAVLVEYESVIARAGEEARNGTAASAGTPDSSDSSCFEGENVPILSGGVRVFRLAADYQKVIERLRRKEKPRRVLRRSVVIVLKPAPNGETQVIQLSALSGQLIELCDGRRTVDEIGQSLASEGLVRAGGIPADKVCFFGLEVLRQQGFIVAAPPGGAIVATERAEPAAPGSR